MKKRAVSFVIIFVMLVSLIPIVSFGAGETIITDSYGEGLLKYQDKSKKYGYVDVFGNVVIKASFISANPFQNGMAKVQVKGGGYAQDEFIDRSGKVIIKAPKKTKTRYYGLCDTWEGDYATVEIWSVQKDGSISSIGYNYTDSKGKLLNDQEYMYAGAFTEGYALVGTGYSYKKMTRSSISGKNEHWMAIFEGNNSKRVATEYYYIGKDGEQLGTMKWSIGRSFSEGMAAVAVTAGDALHWGFIDNTGALRIGLEYDSVGDFVNGMAWVSAGDKFGYVNKDGELVIPMQWAGAGDFSADGYAVVKDEYYARIIDTTGGTILDTEYDSLTAIEGTDRYVAYDGLARGMIDRSGKVLIPLAYRYMGGKNGLVYGTRYENALMVYNEFGDMITPVIINGEAISEEKAAAYPDGTACKKLSFPVTTGENTLNMCMFTDESGTILSINMIDSMRGETFTLARSNGKTLLFNLDGNQIGNTEWDGTLFYSAMNEHVIGMKKGDFYGFVDIKTGKTIQTPQYTDAKIYSDGVIGAMLGKNVIYLDSHARTLLPTITQKSKKDDIKDLQQLLSDKGYFTGNINGGYSKQLTAAISAAQEALGLEPTGIADSDFQYALRGE